MIPATQNGWHFCSSALHVWTSSPAKYLAAPGTLKALRDLHAAWLHHLYMTQLRKPLCTCMSSVTCVCHSYVNPLCACARQPLNVGYAVFSPLVLHTAFTLSAHISSNKLLSGFVACFLLPSHLRQVISAITSPSSCRIWSVSHPWRSYDFVGRYKM